MSMPIVQALQMAARTHPGLLRLQNEDAIYIDAGSGLAILADGMGGYNGGEVASSMAVALLAEGFAEVMAQCAGEAWSVDGADLVQDCMTAQIARANLAIFNAAQAQSQYVGMGTTLVMAWFYDNSLFVAHAGDSRLYRLRGKTLEQLTHDHSLLQEQIDRGEVTPEAARDSDIKNLVTRALGVAPDVAVSFGYFPVQAGDFFLLCSDGLNDMLSDEQIARVMQSALANSAAAAEALIEFANRQGGRDNVSVILIKVLGDYAAPRGWWQKLLTWLK